MRRKRQRCRGAGRCQYLNIHWNRSAFQTGKTVANWYSGCVRSLSTKELGTIIWPLLSKHSGIRTKRIFLYGSSWHYFWSDALWIDGFGFDRIARKSPFAVFANDVWHPDFLLRNRRAEPSSLKAFDAWCRIGGTDWVGDWRVFGGLHRYSAA